MQSLVSLIAHRLASRAFSTQTAQRLMPVTVTIMLLAVNAMAVAGPPMPAIRRLHPPWVGYAVMFILLAIVMLVSLMPSRRSHQD